MACDHDLAEKETACADGLCPLCAVADIARTKAALATAAELIEELRDYARAAWDDKYGERWDAETKIVKDALIVQLMVSGDKHVADL